MTGCCVTGSVTVSCGGGKSGFRRIDSLLHRRLKYLSAEVLGQVTDLFFAAGNPLAIGSKIDGLDHRLQISVGLVFQRFDEFLWRQDLPIVSSSVGHDDGSDTPKHVPICFTRSPKFTAALSQSDTTAIRLVHQVIASRVALGDFSPRAPSDPCVRTLAHTVPLMMDSPCSKLQARTAILGRDGDT